MSKFNSKNKKNSEDSLRDLDGSDEDFGFDPLGQDSEDLDLGSDDDAPSLSLRSPPKQHAFRNSTSNILNLLEVTGDIDERDNSMDDESKTVDLEDILEESSDDSDEDSEDDPSREKFHIRDYQEKIYQDMITRDKNSIIFLETGTGKTIISILIIAHYLYEKPKKKVLFLANTQNLVEQQKNQIKKIFPLLQQSREFRYFDLERKMFSIHGEKKHKDNKKFVLKKEQYKAIKVLIISPQTFLNMLRRNNSSLKDFSLLIFDECHHTQGYHPYNQIMQEFYHTMSSSDEKPRVLGLTASPILSINKAVSYEKIKESFEQLKKNLDSEFLEIDHSQIPKNESEVRPIAYQNDESICQDFSEDRDLLEIANTRGFYKFFEDVRVQDFDYLRDLKEIPELLAAEKKIKTLLMKIIYIASKKLLLENSIVILLELGKYPLYKQIEAFKMKLESVKHHDQYQALRNEDKELLGFLEDLFNTVLKRIEYMNNEKLLSNKFKRLLNILANSIQNSENQNNEEKPRTMIFTDTRYIARMLSEYINIYGKSLGLASQYIIGKVQDSIKLNPQEDTERVLNIDSIQGHVEALKTVKPAAKIIESKKENTKDIQLAFSEPVITIDLQMTKVEDFRQGKYNVLVSTSVTEEGFDTPACNVVIAYNEPDSLKSYIQMKGRARKENSTFYILVHKSKEDEWDNRIQVFKAAIDVMKASAYLPAKNVQAAPISEGKKKMAWLSKKPVDGKKEDGIYKYQITAKGLNFNTNWSAELVALFCSKFTADDLIDSKPKYHFIRIPSLGYLCCVIMPPGFREQVIVGGFTATKSDAKKLAAFTCCQKLYEARDLNEYLKPQCTEENLIEKLSIKRIFDFGEEQDAVISEKLKKIIISQSENRQKCMYPLTTLNPFTGPFARSRKYRNRYVGHMYRVEFSKKLSGQEAERFPQINSLGFVYFNKDLIDVELKVDLLFEDKTKLMLKYIGEHHFDREEYQRLFNISRWMDATTRSWDVNFFEMASNKSTDTKSPLYRKRRALNGVEMEPPFNSKNEPIYPFYVILDQQDKISEETIKQIYDYLIDASDRYDELHQQPIPNRKFSINKKYFNKFKQNPESMSKVLVQSSISFNKYVILGQKPIKSADLFECKSEEMSLNLRLMTVIEPNYYYIVGSDDHVLTMKSLGRYSQMLIKGKDCMNTHEVKAFKKEYHGVLGEFLEYPLELGIVLQLQLFKHSLANIRDHLRTVHFKNSVLLKLEEGFKETDKCTWEFTDLDALDLPIDDISKIIEEKASIGLISENSMSEIKNILAEVKEESVLKDEKEKIDNEEEMSFAERKLFTKDLSIESLKLALSTKEYNNIENYERKEMLGDAVLKLLATIEVFARVPTGTEYELHMERTKIINNLNLFRHSVKHDLYEFILKKKKEELPISYKKNEELKQQLNSTVADKLNENITKDNNEEEKKENDTEKENEEGKLSKIPSNYEELHYKTIADVVEALVAVYSEQGRLDAAQRFLNMIGVLKYSDFKYDFLNEPNNKLDQIRVVKKMKSFIERKLNNLYQFKDCGLIVQAFCHMTMKLKMQALFSNQNSSVLDIKSITESKEEETETFMQLSDFKKIEGDVDRIRELSKKINSSLSYERLEFLGDAILDYYVVEYLYDKYPTASPGEMTAMKSAVVNNHALSLICIKNEFDKLLVADIPGFVETGAKVREKINVFWEDLDSYFESYNYNFIKVTGDVIEALIGAVYLDSKQDLTVTYKVIEHLCGEMITKYGDEKHWKDQPQYLFTEYCKKNELEKPRIRKLDESEVSGGANGFATWVLESDGNVYAKYNAHTTAWDVIQKKLYKYAWKEVRKA